MFLAGVHEAGAPFQPHEAVGEIAAVRHVQQADRGVLRQVAQKGLREVECGLPVVDRHEVAVRIVPVQQQETAPVADSLDRVFKILLRQVVPQDAAVVAENLRVAADFLHIQDFAFVFRQQLEKAAEHRIVVARDRPVHFVQHHQCAVHHHRHFVAGVPFGDVRSGARRRDQQSLAQQLGHRAVHGGAGHAVLLHQLLADRKPFTGSEYAGADILAQVVDDLLVFRYEILFYHGRIPLIAVIRRLPHPESTPAASQSIKPVFLCDALFFGSFSFYIL